MGPWDEVCLICGVPSHTPKIDGIERTVWTVMRNLKHKVPPSFLDNKADLKNADEIEHRITDAVETLLVVLLRESPFFYRCLLVGHFHKTYKFDVPWRLARLRFDDQTKNEKTARTQRFTRLILPGRGARTRVANGSHRSGDFELREEDEQFFATIPNDPGDRDVDDPYPLDYLAHPPEATRGFRSSVKLTFKTSSGPDSYLGWSPFSDNRPVPWEGFGNFWVTKGCFEFLKAWVCLPPAQNGLYEANGEEPLTFEEEFYEVVNSRKNGRTSGVGTMTEIKYAGMHFAPFRPAPRVLDFSDLSSVAKVLAEEGDDSELVDAVLRDTKQWRYCCPSSWPKKSQVEGQRPLSPMRTRVVAAIGCPIINLPMDTLEAIFKDLDDVCDYFSLARTCTSLYNALQNPKRLNQVFREMASHPSKCLFWIRPLRNELVELPQHLDAKDTALRVLEDWCPRKDVQGASDDSQPCDRDVQAVMDAFDDPAFEWTPFVRACYLSNSMRNRRRIWKQVKQIEAMWKDYHLNGWQVNRFITKDQGLRAK